MKNVTIAGPYDHSQNPKVERPATIEKKNIKVHLHLLVFLQLFDLYI